MANNSKSRQIQQGIIRSAQKKLAEKQAKIKETRVEADAAELLNAALVMEVEKMEKDLAEAQEGKYFGSTCSKLLTGLEAEENAFNEVCRSSIKTCISGAYRWLLASTTTWLILLSKGV
eukprot:Gregarina_sp_Poly_1__9472@NODE_594_length_7275_cov_67_691593_g459_i0_p6_GENE_NODE_594_length_7275_cov_67_691593_g459_i0NODE_594_length_7275_cov_67_691593_g459_i0_p6_ORF_typecomplete_len119_score19_84MT/PF12777_7/0_022KLRAQ/PF10205_9/0_044_NODE_594_length_7275_cov_67_691593_g459_i068767232